VNTADDSNESCETDNVMLGKEELMKENEKLKTENENLKAAITVINSKSGHVL
jgi:hypothetical protein